MVLEDDPRIWTDGPLWSDVAIIAVMLVLLLLGIIVKAIYDKREQFRADERLKREVNRRNL